MIGWDPHPLEDAPQQACRSCGSPMVWAVVESSGKRMPLDPSPTDDGNVRVLRLSATTGAPLVEVVRKDQAQLGLDESDSGHRYRTHFATCPDAPSHRRRR